MSLDRLAAELLSQQDPVTQDHTMGIAQMRESPRPSVSAIQRPCIGDASPIDHASALARARQRVQERRAQHASLGLSDSVAATPLLPPSSPTRPNTFSAASSPFNRIRSTSVRADSLINSELPISRRTPLLATLSDRDDAAAFLPQQRYRRRSLSRGTVISPRVGLTVQGSTNAITKHFRIDIVAPIGSNTDISDTKNKHTKNPNDEDDDDDGRDENTGMNSLSRVEQAAPISPIATNSTSGNIHINTNGDTDMDNQSQATPTKKKKKTKKRVKQTKPKHKGIVKTKREIELVEFEPMKDEEIQEFDDDLPEPVPVLVELKKWMQNQTQVNQELHNLVFHPLAMPLNLPPTWMERIRFLEDEGLFVGQPPPIRPWNMERLRKRLELTESDLGQRWLGPSCKVAIEPDPLQYVRTRSIQPIFNRDFGNISDNDDDDNDNDRGDDKRHKQHRPHNKASFDVDGDTDVKDDQNTHTSHENPTNRAKPTKKHDQLDTDIATHLCPAEHAADHARRLGAPTGTGYVLAIDLIGMQFHDHPLMTEELRLSNTIMDIANAIYERKRTNLVGFLSAKAQALRSEYDDFKRTSPFSDQIALSAEPDEIPPEADNDIQSPNGIYSAQPVRATVLTRVREASQRERARLARLYDESKRHTLLEEIRSTRLLRDAEEQTDRLLEFRILRAWESLKSYRASDGYSTSPISLRVIVREASAEDDKSVYEADVADEVSELEDLHVIEQLRKKRQYVRDLQQWKVRQASGHYDTAGRYHINEQLHSDSEVVRGRGDDDDADMAKTPTELEPRHSLRSTPRRPRASSLSRTVAPPKPSEPRIRPFNTKRTRTQIIQRIKASRRPQGSPILSFVVEINQSISDISACPRRELARRRELDATFVYLRFFYNNKEVTRTVARPLPAASFAITFSGIADLSEADKLVKSSVSHSAAGSDGTSTTGSKTTFCIRVNEAPESLRAEVYEAGVFGDVFLGEVFIAVPDAAVHSHAIDREAKQLQFTGRPFSPVRAGGATQVAAGSGVSASSKHDSQPERWITGVLKMGVSWAVDKHGRSLGPPPGKHAASELRHAADPISLNGPPGLLNLPKLMEWIADMNIDPNDPRNTDVLRLKSLLQSVSGLNDPTAQSISDYWKSRNVFRLGIPRWLHRLAFGVGNEHHLHASKRLDLLAARYKKEVLVREAVPLIESDIYPGIYERVVKDDLLENEENRQYLSGSSWSIQNLQESISRRPEAKNLGIGFLKRVRELQLVRKAQLARPVTIDDYVREERLVPPPEQQSSFKFLFRPYRPLNPVRTDRLATVTASPESCRIVVQVLRGFNLPVRKSALVLSNAAARQGAPPVYISPFVEVSFQQRKLRTSTAEGQHPQWNEAIHLDMHVPDNDFTPEALNNGDIGTEMLFINLYDEVLVDLIRDERERATSVHHRRERVWLGSIQIPFSTIWEQTRIDGEFKVRLPPESHGYEQKMVEAPGPFGTEAGTDTLLHLFVTVDPPLLQPAPLKIKFQSDEDPKLLHYADQWVSSYKSRKRVVMATTQDLHGRTTLICRFVRPQEPPARLTSVSHLVRFVSTIPYIPNRTAFGCECLLWSTTAEILKVGAANGVELAILLCNFLLARGHGAYVLLGRGIPEGVTAYVLVKPADDGQRAAAGATETPFGAESVSKLGGSLLSLAFGGSAAKNKASEGGSGSALATTRERNNLAGTAGANNDTFLSSSAILSRSSALAPGWKLYHPITGEEHDLTDTHPRLKEIGCIFNDKNIWANIQTRAEPRRVHFRLQDTNSWRPFFGQQFPAPTELKSVQPMHVRFPETPSREIIALESAIESAIIAKVEQWREGRVTRWNRLCSRTFKSLMSRFESDLIAGVGIQVSLSDAPELASISNVYRLNGFPLNITFTDIAAVCALVHNTAVYANYASGVEFAVAVHCIGYPGRFVSVWVYISSLVRYI